MKVGDRVIVKNVATHGGESGTVKELRGLPLDLLVRLDGYSYDWQFMSEEVELLEGK